MSFPKFQRIVLKKQFRNVYDHHNLFERFEKTSISMHFSFFICSSWFIPAKQFCLFPFFFTSLRSNSGFFFGMLGVHEMWSVMEKIGSIILKRSSYLKKIIQTKMLKKGCSSHFEFFEDIIYLRFIWLEEN